MEQNNEEIVFEIEKLSQRNQKLLYEKILQAVLMAKPETLKGQVALGEAIEDYIKLTANRRGIFCTYTFRHDTKKLTDKEKEELKKTDAGVNFAYAQPQFNNIEFSNFILSPESLGDFVFYVSIIEHEFQHLVNNRDKDFYSEDNPLGLKMEYCSHRPALEFLHKFLEANPKSFDFAEKVLLKSTIRALYYFDDNERSARRCGIKAQQELLKDLSKVAKKFSVPGFEVKALSGAIMLDEQEVNFKQHHILEETQKEMHTLLYKLQKIAIDTKNHTLAEAVAETQDIKQLYNPLIYRNLNNFAINEKNPTLSLLLDNSKYTKVSNAKIKHDIQKYIEENPARSKQDAFYLLFNKNPDNLIKMFKNPPLSIAPAPKIVVAHEYSIDGPALSVDGQAFVDKAQSKTAKKAKTDPSKIIIAKEKTEINLDLIFKTENDKERAVNKIIVAKETEPNKPKRGRPRKNQIIVAEEVEIKEEGPPAYEQLFEKTEENGVIEAKEDLSGSEKLSELSNGGFHYMNHRKMRAEKKSKNLDDGRNM